MLNQYGGIKTAKQLLSTEQPSDGFLSLYESQRWDFSVEYFVLKKDFQQLFTQEELAEARKRLKEVGFLKE